MSRILDEEILEIYARTEKTRDLGANVDSEFTLEDLVGEAIMESRKLDTQSNMESHVYPGRYLNVLIFKSGRMLIIGEDGHQDYSINHYLLVDEKREVKYSDRLFNTGIMSD